MSVITAVPVSKEALLCWQRSFLRGCVFKWDSTRPRICASRAPDANEKMLLEDGLRG